MTVRLSLLSKLATSKYHTSVLALGWSKNDRIQLFDHVMDEESQLHIPKRCHCSLTNSFCWVVFGLCFNLVNRPELDAQLNLLAMEEQHQNSLVMFPFIKLQHCHHVICVTNHGCGIVKLGDHCINVTHLLAGTFMIIPKHLPTVSYCMGIKLNRCLTLNLQRNGM